jgi:hypothetical protein
MWGYDTAGQLTVPIAIAVPSTANGVILMPSF